MEVSCIQMKRLGEEGWMSTFGRNLDFHWDKCYTFRAFKSTAVEQVVACALVTQRARVRSPVGTSFLDEVFSGFYSPVRQMSGSSRPPRSPNIIWPSLSSIINHYGRQWPEMLTRPKKNLKKPRAFIQHTKNEKKILSCRVIAVWIFLG